MSNSRWFIFTLNLHKRQAQLLPFCFDMPPDQHCRLFRIRLYGECCAHNIIQAFCEQFHDIHAAGNRRHGTQYRINAGSHSINTDRYCFFGIPFRRGSSSQHHIVYKTGFSDLYGKRHKCRFINGFHIFERFRIAESRIINDCFRERGDKSRRFLNDF